MFLNDFPDCGKSSFCCLQRAYGNLFRYPLFFFALLKSRMNRTKTDKKRKTVHLPAICRIFPFRNEFSQRYCCIVHCLQFQKVSDFLSFEIPDGCLSCSWFALHVARHYLNESIDLVRSDRKTLFEKCFSCHMFSSFHC